jgi:hypothetical protein
MPGAKKLLTPTTSPTSWPAHHDFLANNPDVVAFAQDWADRNLDDLVQR